MVLVHAEPAPIKSKRHLLLIRHARTRVQPGIAPATWPLDNRELAAIHELRARLTAYSIAALVTSKEPKAIATGRVLGDELALEPSRTLGLHEHERGADDYVANQAAFELRLGRFFLHHDERVFGRESAREAQQRFAGAVGTVLRKHTKGDVAIVAHGTVITLFVALHNDIDPLAFWRSFGMPACAVLALPTLQPAEMIDAAASD